MNIVKNKVQFIDIDDEIAGQRIDNFLRNVLKNIPKSLIYKILRKGEVRVNKKRIKPEYKLMAGDIVRVPPIAVPDKPIADVPNVKLSKVAELENCIIFEDEHLLALNKPSGTAVHGEAVLALVQLKPSEHSGLRQSF